MIAYSIVRPLTNDSTNAATIRHDRRLIRAAQATEQAARQDQQRNADGAADVVRQLENRERHQVVREIRGAPRRSASSRRESTRRRSGTRPCRPPAARCRATSRRRSRDTWRRRSPMRRERLRDDHHQRERQRRDVVDQAKREHGAEQRRGCRAVQQQQQHRLEHAESAGHVAQRTRADGEQERAEQREIARCRVAAASARKARSRATTDRRPPAAAGRSRAPVLGVVSVQLRMRIGSRDSRVHSDVEQRYADERRRRWRAVPAAAVRAPRASIRARPISEMPTSSDAPMPNVTDTKPMTVAICTVDRPAIEYAR